MNVRFTSSILRWRREIVCTAVIFLVSCSPGRRAAIELDTVARSIDRYGFASISTPFVAGASKEFSFDLDKSPREYFDMASTAEGAVRHYAAEARSVQVALRANIEDALSTLQEFTKSIDSKAFEGASNKAGIQKKLLETLIATDTTRFDKPQIKALLDMLGLVESKTPVKDTKPEEEGQPESDAPEEPNAATDETTAFTPRMTVLPKKGSVFSKDELLALRTIVATFTDGLALPEGKPQINAHTRILSAHRDVTTQALLKWSTHPHNNKLDRYELFMCPMLVSVQPGYQTRDRYLADITVNVDLARRKPNCWCNGSERRGCDVCLSFLSETFCDSSPPILVTGVFPVVDAQVLDLVNSRRQLYSFAMQLSMSGFGSQAEFFSDHAKKLERDVKTQTALTAASAYTIGDTAFGFRVEPKFVASKDPTAFETEPGRILESRTFPALASVLVDRRYLRPHDNNVAFSCESNAAAGGTGTPKSCAECYDYLVFETSTRWSPMTETQRLFGGMLSLGGRVSELEIWKRASALDRAERWMKRIRRDEGAEKERLHLATRSSNLGKLALDSRAIVRVFSSLCPKDVTGCSKSEKSQSEKEIVGPG